MRGWYQWQSDRLRCQCGFKRRESPSSVISRNTARSIRLWDSCIAYIAPLWTWPHSWQKTIQGAPLSSTWSVPSRHCQSSGVTGDSVSGEYGPAIGVGRAEKVEPLFFGKRRHERIANLDLTRFHFCWTVAPWVRAFGASVQPTPQVHRAGEGSADLSASTLWIFRPFHTARGLFP